jgi:hypothetical protein
MKTRQVVLVRKMAAPWFRRLVADLSWRRPVFGTRSVHVGFVVEKWYWERVFSEYFSFVLFISRCMFLPEGQTVEAWEPLEKQLPFYISGSTG